MRIAIAAAVLAVGVGIVVIASGGDGGDKKKPAAAPPKPADPFTKNLPFTEPQPVVSRNGVLKAEITAANSTLKVSGVDVAGGQAYTARNASDVASPPGMLGPTLHAEPGGTIDLTFDNRLTVPEAMRGPEDCVAGADHGHGNSPADAGRPQVTNFHFHGLRVTPETRKIDGVTVYGDNVLVDLKPGRSRIEFPIPKDHEQGTFWYHAHRHGCTDDQVSRGLAGLLFIGDSRKDLPERFRNVETRDVMLQDLQVANSPDGGGWQVDPGHAWQEPTNRMVNGPRQPQMEIRPGETQLWRIANGSAGVWFNVALVDSSDTPVGFTTVAQDGNTLVDSQEEPSHLLGPGNRVDVLVTGPESGELALKTLEFNQGDVDFPEELLASVNVKGAATEPIEAPGQLAPPPRFEPTKGPDREYTFSFASNPFRALINGQAFSIDGPPQATPTLNTTETWTLKNATTQFHPIHIHQGDFVVRSVNGKPVDNHGQQDVVPLPPMQGTEQGEVVFEMSFEEEGDFVFHCHILDHEDAGMMAKVSVTKGRSP